MDPDILFVLLTVVGIGIGFVINELLVKKQNTATVNIGLILIGIAIGGTLTKLIGKEPISSLILFAIMLAGGLVMWLTGPKIIRKR